MIIVDKSEDPQIIETVPLVDADGDTTYVQATPDVVTPPTIAMPIFHPACFALVSPPLSKDEIDEVYESLKDLLNDWRGFNDRARS